jgi:beta-lactamase regulating signal transducer with metallopeptidase domain
VLVWSVAQVTLLALVAGTIYCAGRRLGPAIGAFVCLTTLMMMIAITVFSFSPWPNWLPAIQSRFATSSLPAGSLDGSSGHLPRAAGDDDRTRIAAGPRSPAVLESPIVEAARAFWHELRHPRDVPQVASRSLQWTGLVALVVVAGAVIGLIRLVAGWLLVQRYRRDGRPIQDAPMRELVDVLAAELGCRRPIAVRECQQIAGAATIGWRRPLLLLPAGWRQWSDKDRCAVIAHEIAHIARGDYLTCLMAQVGVALHFYHPLAHWLCRSLRLNQELIADSTAARLVGDQQAYLQSLAAIALQQIDAPVSWPARTFLPTRRTFLRRIEMLRDSQEKWLGRSPASARWMAGAVLLATGLVVSGLRRPDGAASGVALAQQPKPAAARPGEGESF